MNACNLCGYETRHGSPCFACWQQVNRDREQTPADNVRDALVHLEAARLSCPETEDIGPSDNIVQAMMLLRFVRDVLRDLEPSKKPVTEEEWDGPF